jgi:hypothetical protein
MSRVMSHYFLFLRKFENPNTRLPVTHCTQSQTRILNFKFLRMLDQSGMPSPYRTATRPPICPIYTTGLIIITRDDDNKRQI